MTKEISKLQYITQDSERFSHAEQARLMFENGVDWVQIRMKNYPERDILEQSIEALAYARKYKAKLIINDAVEIAKEIDAHGVHLGLNDIPVNEARSFLGEEFIIGGTANTFKDIENQIAKGADYIGLGPFRFTQTKEKLSPIIGLDGYQSLCTKMKENKITTPIVAVGGITMEDIELLMDVGLHGVAISTVLLRQYEK